jgi:uncharacterized protein YqjF (DUF2071 family)
MSQAFDALRREETSAMIVAQSPRAEIEPPPSAPHEPPFLTASWCDFLMLTYEIEPRVLDCYIPRGTQLDRWRGRAYASLVGFRFCDARLFGWRIPWHQEFAEVNLRFYVRRRVGGAWRRGVVFLRELAAKRAVGAVARWLYGERFRRVPLRCRAERPTGERAPPATDEFAAPCRLAFEWRDHRRDFRLAGDVRQSPHAPAPESLEEFVVEHYWAYTARRRATIEYRVVHRPWRVAAADALFTGDAYRQYGPRFAPFLQGEPAAAFWADGSPVSVYAGCRL